jgi:pimeloyl-ACP methyl ester carboxylesterase
VPQISTSTNRLLNGRTNRRRFVAGIAAVGLTPSTVGATESTLSNVNMTKAQEGTIVAQQTEEAVTTDYLAVPGARLYYEVSGSGPVLLLIPGGPVDADGFAPIVPFLKENYTVVRYDPRGISRSALDDPAAEVPVERHADDAQQLLLAIGDEPAYVLGSSGGAVIGVALAERHPDLVQTLVAHEPPLVGLLEQSERSTAEQATQEIYDTYLEEGAGPAMEKFMAVAGMDGPPPADLSPEELEAMEQQMASVLPNLDFFLGNYLLPITSYMPDIAALQAASTRVVVAVGEETDGEEAHRTALALAERLGTEAVTFPGDHMGFIALPEAFTQKLHEVFQAG